MVENPIVKIGPWSKLLGMPKCSVIKQLQIIVIVDLCNWSIFFVSHKNISFLGPGGENLPGFV